MAPRNTLFVPSLGVFVLRSLRERRNVYFIKEEEGETVLGTIVSDGSVQVIGFAEDNNVRMHADRRNMAGCFGVCACLFTGGSARTGINRCKVSSISDQRQYPLNAKESVGAMTDTSCSLNACSLICTLFLLTLSLPTDPTYANRARSCSSPQVARPTTCPAAICALLRV